MKHNSFLKHKTKCNEYHKTVATQCLQCKEERNSLLSGEPRKVHGAREGQCFNEGPGEKRTGLHIPLFFQTAYFLNKTMITKQLVPDPFLSNPPMTSHCTRDKTCTLSYSLQGSTQTGSFSYRPDTILPPAGLLSKSPIEQRTCAAGHQFLLFYPPELFATDLYVTGVIYLTFLRTSCSSIRMFLHIQATWQSAILLHMPLKLRN